MSRPDGAGPYPGKAGNPGAVERRKTHRGSRGRRLGRPPVREPEGAQALAPLPTVAEGRGGIIEILQRAEGERVARERLAAVQSPASSPGIIIEMLQKANAEQIARTQAKAGKAGAPAPAAEPGAREQALAEAEAAAAERARLAAAPAAAGAGAGAGAYPLAGAPSPPTVRMIDPTTEILMGIGLSAVRNVRHAYHEEGACEEHFEDLAKKLTEKYNKRDFKNARNQLAICRLGRLTSYEHPPPHKIRDPRIHGRILDWLLFIDYVLFHTPQLRRLVAKESWGIEIEHFPPKEKGIPGHIFHLFYGKDPGNQYIGAITDRGWYNPYDGRGLAPVSPAFDKVRYDNHPSLDTRMLEEIENKKNKKPAKPEIQAISNAISSTFDTLKEQTRPRLPEGMVSGKAFGPTPAEALRAAAGGRRKTRRYRGGQDKYSPLARKFMIHRHHEKTIIPQLQRDLEEARAYNAALGERARTAATPEERAALTARQLQHAKSVHESAKAAVSQGRAARQEARAEFNAVGGRQHGKTHRRLKTNRRKTRKY
jgi:hypothetical protein